MSLARVYTTQKVRKDWTCGKCGAAIRKGVDGRVSFSVGFRGFERTRCLKPECYPKPSERESSAVSEVYAAQEEVDVNAAQSLEDLYAIRDQVAEACENVASEYEANEMYEINADLQERAEMVRSAGDELANWEPEEDEPDEGEEEVCREQPTFEHTKVCGLSHLDSFEEAHDAWLNEARESLESAINEMELP